MKLIYLIITTLLLMGVVSASSSELERPIGVINQNTPFVVWKINLTTDADGDASYTKAVEGRLYSIDTLKLGLDATTNVVVKRVEPYETTIQTVNANAGNNTTYPRVNGEMYSIFGDMSFTISGGNASKNVPVYVTLIK